MRKIGDVEGSSEDTFLFEQIILFLKIIWVRPGYITKYNKDDISGAGKHNVFIIYKVEFFRISFDVAVS